MEKENMTPDKELIDLAVRYQYEVAVAISRNWARQNNGVPLRQCFDSAAPLAAVILAQHLKETKP